LIAYRKLSRVRILVGRLFCRFGRHTWWRTEHGVSCPFCRAYKPKPEEWDERAEELEHERITRNREAFFAKDRKPPR